VIELPREVSSEVKKSQNGKETKTVGKLSSSNATIEKEKTVQKQSSSIKVPITISEKPKVQLTLEEKAGIIMKRYEEKPIKRSSINPTITNSEKPKVQNTLQKPKPKETSSDDYEYEYEEEEEDDVDFFKKEHRSNKRNQTDVTKLHQKPKLYMNSSEDYSE
jgi:hypothetical protein